MPRPAVYKSTSGKNEAAVPKSKNIISTNASLARKELKMKYSAVIFIVFISFQIGAQSLFEDAVSGDSGAAEATEKRAYELNGYVRGVFCGGKIPDKNEAEVKSEYAEASLKLKVQKHDFGDAFMEIRFCEADIDLREAYVSIYPGSFDFCIGRQIVAWGRADAFNPTNIITPQNMLVRSVEEDDRREGNFLVRSFYNLKPFRIEAIWIPVYSPSLLPLGMSPEQTDYPDSNLKNSGFAAKLNVELASFESSFCYFNGYNPFPGNNIEGSSIIATAYRIHMAGADFSTAVASYGLRGEFAFRYPCKDYESNVYIPNPDLQYVLGVDREFGDFSIIMQYSGRYVLDYTELLQIASPIEKNNRMFSGQQNQVSHTLSFRHVLSLLHEILFLELFASYNLTTEELFLRPKVFYDITDALRVTLAAELFTGPDETLYGTIDEQSSALFLELKASF